MIDKLSNKAMAKIPNNVLGAIGEHQTLSMLLLKGHQAAITNLSVKNNAATDIFCRNADGNYAAIQVKTTSGKSFQTGISHKAFYDSNGQIDLVRGRKFLEQKIVGPWVLVQLVNNGIVPAFNFFVLSRSQIIEMIYSNEAWYLTGYYNRAKQLKDSGTIHIYATWMFGHGVPSNKNHIEWVNPFPTTQFHNAWHNLWID